MTWLMLVGAIVVGWAWVVAGAAAFQILVDHQTHRREGELSRGSKLVQLWSHGVVRRVR